MTKPKVVLLGTGSPRPSAERAQPAQLLEIGGHSFVIDCGDGVTTQIVRAGRDVNQIQKIFLTHLHWDHVLGYAGLIWGGWSAGRATVEVWGPAGTKRMHDTLFGDLYRGDVDWISNIAYVRSGIEGIQVHEVGEGRVYERDGVSVDAMKVKHPVMTLAYRFSYLGKSIVFSGDTAMCDELIKIARGADLLVQDTCAASSRLYGDERSKKIRQALIDFHASPQQAGVMAQKAGVKRLVCSHLLPGVLEDEVREEAESDFTGETIVGRDLMELIV